MIKRLALLLAIALPTTAHAYGDFCFQLSDSSNPGAGYSNYKLSIWPPCGPGLAFGAPRISAVHGVRSSFDQFGNATESFLLIGTCASDTDSVVLDAQPLGSNGLLSLFGSSLADANAQDGAFSELVDRVRCWTLEF